jgi:hypothetical protein
MAIRAATARSVVLGMTLADAASEAMSAFEEAPRHVIARPAA